MRVNSTFLDLSLGNWEINTGPWPKEKYDAIVCTRCAYFSRDPVSLVEVCLRMLNPGGILYVDWGLGDHWRFTPYRVGWVGKGQHEHSVVGNHTSLLHSTAWSDFLEDHPEVVKFKTWIRDYGYEGSLSSHILEEVPSVLRVERQNFVDCLALWPESPQLYILTAFVA